MSRRSAFVAIGLVATLSALASPLAAQAGLDFFGEHVYPINQFAGGSFPYAIAVGDLNGDGRHDLAVSCDFTDNISVLLGEAGGGFAPAKVYAAGNRPQSVLIADATGDGHADVLAGNWLDSNVTLLVGDGQGAPPLAMTLAMGLEPVDLAVGDLDHDGWPDLVASGPFALSIRKNQQGVFAPPVLHPLSSSAAPMQLADANEDGDLDVVCVLSGSLAVLPGDGAGGFLAPVLSPLPSGADFLDSLELGDMDANGHLDAVLSLWPVVVICTGDGAGNFSVNPPVTLPGGGGDIALADLDLDGHLDVVAADKFGVTSLLGDGAGGLVAGTTVHVGSVWSRAGIAVADLDFDGRADVVLPNQISNVSVLRGDGLGSFDSLDDPPAPIVIADAPAFPSLGDLDGDGHLDVVLTHSPPLDLVQVLLGDGAGGLAAPTDYHLGSLKVPRSTTLFDLDQDGALDLLTTNTDGHFDGVHLFRGDGAGGLLAPTAIAGVTAANSVAVGDLNDDGLPDLVAGLSIVAVNGLKVFLNDGTGGFTVAGSFASGHPDSIVIGDFDDDGRQDVAFTSGAASTTFAPRILFGDGQGGFEAIVTSPLSVNSSLLVGLDANEDGLTDFACIAIGVTLQVSLATAPRVYAAPVNQATGDDFSNGVRALRVADVNGDGHDDLVTTFGLAAMGLVLGDGDGGFDAVRGYSTWERVTGLAIGDMDEDGKLDAVSTSDSKTFSWPDSRVDVHLNRAVSVAPWSDLGHGLGGAIGVPRLSADGSLQPGSAVTLQISGAKPSGSAVIVLGATALGLPFKGGTLVPLPHLLVFGLPLDAGGEFTETGPWYPGLPPGTTVYFQAWIPDAAGPAGFAATNGLLGVTP